MIIRELYIDSFEGLSGKAFSLSDGINIICGPNESGKSSLADFIFFIFYGVTSRSDAQRFPSLETGVASGSLLAELSEEERSRISAVSLPRLIRIEREYIHRRRDVVHTLDGDTYRELSLPRSPGETLFGISAQVMRSTSYISQIGGHGVDGKDLGSAVENIMLSADESIDISKALSRLDGARAALQHKNGGGGIIPALREERNALLLEKSRAEESSVQISRIETELSGCEDKCRAADERVDRARGRVEYCELQSSLLGASNADSIRERLLELDNEERTTRKEAEYNGFYPSEEYISGLRELDDRISLLRRTAVNDVGVSAAGRGSTSAISPELLQLSAAAEREGGADRLEHRIESSYTRKRVYLITSLILLAVFAFGVFCTAYLIRGYGDTILIALSAGLSLCALIVAACTLVARRKAISEYYSLLMSAGAVDIFDLYRMLDELDRIGDISDAPDDTCYDTAGREYPEYGVSDAGGYFGDGETYPTADSPEELAYLEQELSQQLSLWNKRSVSEALSAYSKLNIRLGEIESERRHRYELLDTDEGGEDAEMLARQKERLAQLSPYIRPDIAAGMCDSDLPASERRRAAERYGREAAKELEFELSARSALSERRHSLKLQLAELRASSPSLAEIVEKLCENETRLAENERRYRAIVLAYERLLGAGNAIHGMIAPELTERVSAITRELTSGKYDRVGIDSEFTMHFSLSEGARTVDDIYLSGGTKDAAYIALRIALSEQLYRLASPVMIFDESFCRIDDSRLDSLLGELSSAGGLQTIILTSNSRESESMDRLGCSCNKSIL